MTVLTKAKVLITTTFQYTENWPKLDRFTLKDRVRVAALEIYENLVLANETFVDFKLLEDLSKSIKHYEQKKKELSFDNPLYQSLEQKLTSLRLTAATQLGDRVSKRRDFQGLVFARLSIMDFYIQLAFERKLITSEKEERWCHALTDVRNLLGAWIRADRKRYNY